MSTSTQVSTHLPLYSPHVDNDASALERAGRAKIRISDDEGLKRLEDFRGNWSAIGARQDKAYALANRDPQDMKFDAVLVTLKPMLGMQSQAVTTSSLS